MSQQDEKSQVKNRAKAIKILRSRLYEMELRKQHDAIAKDRKNQVGTGERSEKIRTYHFKENRVTDHRVNFTLYRLTDVLNGDLAELLDNVVHALPVGEAEGRHRGFLKCGQGRPGHRSFRRSTNQMNERDRVASTIHAQIAAARQRLRDAGIAAEEAALDARLLAQHVLGWDATRLLTAENEAPAADFFVRFDAAVARRARREPLAYITGFKEFWNLTVEVSPDVLIPRPETELLVESVLEWFPDKDASPHVIDVCTGSGCLAVAIASERPRAQLTVTDISEPALAVARRNAARLGVANRVRSIPADLMEGVGGAFDVIVSNPPYVPEGDRPGLQPEVRDFEPTVALFGGADGLDVVRSLVAQSVLKLKPGGVLMFEFGAGQEASVSELIGQTPGLTLVEIKRDLQGLPRAAIARSVRPEA